METVITSSVLILIIAGLRCLLRGKISSRLQYALWILVAIRLLLPFSLFESPFGVMNAIPNAQVHPAAFLLQKVSDDPGRTALPENGVPKPQNDQTAPLHSSGAANGTDWEAMAQFARLCGIFLSGEFFTSSNIRLNRKLKQSRKQMEIPQCPLPVYLTDSLPSPCLYGIGKPVIYLTRGNPVQ